MRIMLIKAYQILDLEAFGGQPMGPMANFWVDGPQMTQTPVGPSPTITAGGFVPPPQVPPFDSGILLGGVPDEIMTHLSDQREGDWTWENLQLDTPEIPILPPIHTAPGPPHSPSTSPPGWEKSGGPQMQIQVLIERLSHLNLQLFSHGELITRAVHADGTGGEFPIDNTFALSQELACTLVKLHQIFEDQSKEPQSSTPPGLPSSRALDRSSMLFILSVYSRLINVYERIFGSASSQASTPEQGPIEPAIRFPALKVGSFSLGSSSFLQMATVAQLAENILTQVKETIQAMEASSAEAFPDEVNRANEQTVGNHYLRQSEEALRRKIRQTINACMEQSIRQT